MTSPFTDRCISVTSSGRSSTRTTMRWHSGLFLVIALAIACRMSVLPALDGDTINPRWPLPIGATKSMILDVITVGSVSKLVPLYPQERHELGEFRPVLGFLRVEAVDLVEPDEGVELLPALAFTWLADGALDHVALAQAVPAHLGKRDVHVVRAGQVPGRADEAVVVEDVENTRDRDEHIIFGDHGLRVAASATLPAPVRALVAVAEPVAVPAPAALVVAVVVAAAPIVAAGIVAAGTVAAGSVPATAVAVTLLVATALLACITLLVSTAGIASLILTRRPVGSPPIVPAAVAAAAPVAALAFPA